MNWHPACIYDGTCTSEFYITEARNQHSDTYLEQMTGVVSVVDAVAKQKSITDYSGRLGVILVAYPAILNFVKDQSCCHPRTAARKRG